MRPGEHRCHYSLQAPVETGEDVELSLKSSTLELRPNRDYDLRVYHYHPSQGDPDSTLGAAVTGTSVSFTMTPELVLDSPYDMKRFRFHTGSPVSGDRGVFTLRQRRTNDAEWEWDFDLPFHLGRSMVRRLGLAALIATVLAAPTITTAWSGNARIVTLAAALSGVAGGIIAAFGIQRSL